MVLVTGLGLLEACGGSEGTGPTTKINVSGVAQDGLGEPIGGAVVLVQGQPSVTTGSDGRFAIPNVAVPYDIALIVSGRNFGILYKGLTRADPTLLDPDDPGVEQSAIVAGTAPPAPDKLTLVFFISGRHVVGGGFADPTTGQFAITARWHGATTTHAGTLHLLRYTIGASGTPASYDGYASKPLAVSAGGTSSGNDFATADIADPVEQTISGTVAVPAGYTLIRRSLYVFFGRVPVVWQEQGTLSNAFTYTVPAVAGTSFSVLASAADAASRGSDFFKIGIAGNSANVSIPLEPAAQLASPPDGAAAVDVTTPFRWTSAGGAGVDIFEAFPDNTANPRLFVFTTSGDAKLPDLTAAGLALPGSASYHWRIDRITSVASMDQAAGAEFVRLIDLEAGDFGETVSDVFGFTTKAGASAALRASVAGPPWTSQGTAQWRGMVTIDASQ